MTLLSVDPGRSKCGLAVVRIQGGRLTVVHREIVATARLVAVVMPLAALFAVQRILLGDGTQSAPLRKALRAALPEIELEYVPEAFTSQRARRRWWEVNPPLGVAKFVPTTLRTPPVPWDDWVAVILAEDWLAASCERPTET